MIGSSLRVAPLLALLVLPLLGWGSPAGALTFTVENLGIDDGWACPSATGGGECFTSRDFEIVPTALAGGTIEYTGATAPFSFGSVDIDVTVGSAIMNGVGGGFDGVGQIVFTNVSYTTDDPWNAFVDATGVIQGLGPVSGTIDGFYELRATPVDPMSDPLGALLEGPTAFTETANFDNFLCPVISGLCSFTAGAQRDFQLDVQGQTPLTDPTSFDFVHTFDVVATPEPGTSGLLLLGMTALAWRRRLPTRR